MNNRTMKSQHYIRMLLTCMLMICTLGAFAENFSSGDGTKDAPYLINNIDDMNAFREMIDNGKTAGVYFNLKDCSYLNGTTFKPLGSFDHPFEGVLFCSSYVTFNKVTFAYENDNQDYVGFFAAIKGATIKAESAGTIISFQECKINTNNNYVGLLAGIVTGNAIISGVLNYASSVTGNEFVGGLIGCVGDRYCGTPTIENCLSSGNITGNNSVGGICGLIENPANIESCMSCAYVTANKDYAGGLVGRIKELDAQVTTIAHSFNSGLVVGENSAGLVGALVDNSGNSIESPKAVISQSLNVSSNEKPFCSNNIKISQSLYDKQVSLSISESEYGKITSELIGSNFKYKNALGGESYWKFDNNEKAYPMPKFFQSKAVANTAVSAIMLANNETAASVASDFELATFCGSWSCDLLTIDGSKAIIGNDYGKSELIFTSSNGKVYKKSYIINIADPSQKDPDDNKDEIVISWSDKNIVYGKNLSKVLNATAKIKGVLVAGSFEYTCNENPIDAESIFSAGDYTLTATFTPENEKYAPVKESIMLTVEKKSLFVSVPDYFVNLNDNLPTFELKYKGFVNGDSEADLQTKPVVSCSAENTKTVGEYELEVSGGVSSNYDFEYESGSLTISEKSVIIIDNDEEKDPVFPTKSREIVVKKQFEDINVSFGDVVESIPLKDIIKCEETLSFDIQSTMPQVCYATIVNGEAQFVTYSEGIAKIKITATNESGDAITRSFYINVVATKPMNVTADIKSVSCYGKTDGSIQLNVTGGEAPYFYKWLSSNRTDSVLYNVGAGDYSVLIYDIAGSAVFKTFTVPSPDMIKINANITKTVCGESDGSIELNVAGGEGSFSYMWNDNSTNSSLKNLPIGIYSVSVVDGKGCKASKYFSVNDPNGPILNIDSVRTTKCDRSEGAVFVSANSPYNVSYLWNNNSTNQNLENVAVGEYSVLATDAMNCQSVALVNVGLQPLIQPEIAVVSVDSESGKNQVVWVREKSDVIDYYTIYRETSIAGQFDSVGYSPYTYVGLYFDNDTSVKPNNRSYRYQISATDVCGNKTPVSESHKTILLQEIPGLNGEAQLIWDSYEGTSFVSYYLYEHTKSGDVNLVDVLPANLHSYNVLDLPEDVIAYHVEIELPDTVRPAGYLKEEAPPFMIALSNIAEAKMSEPIDAIGEFVDVNINQKVSARNRTISVNNSDGSEVEIFDSLGRLITKSKAVGELNFEMPAIGIYNVVINGEAFKLPVY